MPATDNTSKCSSSINAGKISAASMPWQSSRYNSFRRDFNDSAKIYTLEDVRREHWLRFMDLSAGAEETSARKPPSESRHAPLRDRVDKLDKCLGDCAKVETTT